MLQWSHWATLAMFCTIAVLTTQMLFCDGSRENIAKYASLNVSSTSHYQNNNYEKINVVDGIVDGTSRGDIDRCACCFASGWEETPTFIAQFKGHFYIDEIKIVGQKRQQNIDAELSNTIVYFNEKVVDNVSWDRSSNTISITQSADVQTFRIVKASTLAKSHLVICELEIYSTACQDGYYGVRCENVCRCMDASPCNRDTGSCPGNCDYAWTGSDCSTDNNLLSRIKNAVVTSMTRAWNNFNSLLSIDGNYKYTDFESCRCCSIADPRNQPPWWELDLNERYLIKKIYVVGRKYDIYEQSKDLIIIISNYSQASNGTQLEQQHDITVYTYDFDQPRLFQFLRIERSNIDIMTICEVRVVEGDGSQITFGDKCGRYCHCRDGKSCDKVTGKCKTPGCNPGWIGMACDQVCPHGSFGDNCSSECHCLNGTNCGNVDGVCDNHLCAAGWALENCSQVCPHGSFGDNCSSECHCLNGNNCGNVDGVCDNHLCAAGWALENCSQELPDEPTLTWYGVLGFSKMIAIIIITSGIVILLAAVILGVVCIRRRVSNKSEEVHNRGAAAGADNREVDERNEEIHEYEEMHEYEGLAERGSSHEYEGLAERGPSHAYEGQADIGPSHAYEGLADRGSSHAYEGLADRGPSHAYEGLADRGSSHAYESMNTESKTVTTTHEERVYMNSW